MKNRSIKIIFILIVTFFMTGCKNNLERIDYNELKEKVNQKETFILEITQDNCSHCEEFTPRFKSVLDTYHIKAYNLNLTDLSKDDYNELNQDYHIEGTPTTLFFKKGNELVTSRINGSTSDTKLINSLKRLAYIK